MYTITRGTLRRMENRLVFFVAVMAMGGCGTSVRVPDAALMDAGPREAEAVPSGDAGFTDADARADAGAGACPEGLAEDGVWCVGWRAAAGPQACIDGASELVRSTVVPAGETLGLLAIRCPDEPLQLYVPGGDIWFRRREGTTTPVPSVDSPAPPFDYPPIVAAGVLPDGTEVAVAGSLFATGPFVTLIADPGAPAWHASIEAPWMSYQNAGALDDDDLPLRERRLRMAVRARRALIPPRAARAYNASMRRTLISVAVLVAACGHGSEPVAAPPAPTTPAPEPALAPATAPGAGGWGRPGTEACACAFASLDALCASLRESYTAYSASWVSEGCGRGRRQTSSGAFAEVLAVAVRVGYDQPEDGTLVERPLLETTVREPASAGSATPYYVLAARVGERWFPLELDAGSTDDASSGVPFEWSLDPSGDLVTWTSTEGGGDRTDPTGYGRVERTVVGVDQGTPKIVAQAVVESWRSDVDLPCTRACNTGPTPPPYPGCERRCATITRTTRAWERRGAAFVIGATEVRVEGRPGDASPYDPARPEETKRLDAPDEWLGVCGFTPIVHAVAPAELPSDPEFVAARERAAEAMRHGRWASVAGARAAAGGAERNAVVEIYGNSGSGCGGGGCTAGVQLRTIDGSMPEQGVSYFYADDDRGPGCDPRTLPTGEGSTFVEVAPVASDDSIRCGFTGYDGTTRRSWVVLRVFVPSR